MAEHAATTHDVREKLESERSIRFVAVPWNPASGARPGTDQMIVHFIRHGQGFHNAAAARAKEMGGTFPSGNASADAVMTLGGAVYTTPYMREEMVDPPLTQSGRDQARALQPRTALLAPLFVAVSPLSRAALTGLLAFAHAVDRSASRARSIYSRSPDLSGAVPFVAHELLRERIGVHTCDKRRTRSESEFDFPYVDFSLISELDTQWTPAKRETDEEISSRGYALLCWLHDATRRFSCDAGGAERKEVAVATHSSWLLSLFTTVLEIDRREHPGLTEWFATGEMRSVMVTLVAKA